MAGMENRENEKTAGPARKLLIHLCSFFVCLFCVKTTVSQPDEDSIQKQKQYKNVIRYNLSGALLFGADKYIVFGYERVIKPHQSISVNFGKASLPRLVNIVTDSFALNGDKKSTGINASIDYRFYLAKENKFQTPHGLYIGPYYSFNKFDRDSRWDRTRSGAASFVTTNTEFTINTLGFELGYQLVLWKRLTLDFLMVGPGIGLYDYHVKFDGDITPADKEQLLDGLKQMLTQKFPGMNFVFSDEEISSNGTLNTTAMSYRYLIHIGFLF